MANILDFPARGKIVEAAGEKVIFHPTGTTYQLHLDRAGQTPPNVSDKPVEAIIRVRARKVLTVPSGGLFIAPIFGPPRIVQGRVRWLDEQQLLVNAGTMIVVELPVADSAFDLGSGPIETGKMVNVTVMPGATIELRQSAPV